MLKKISIPDSVTSIGKSAFCSCDLLSIVTIGNSVTSIGEQAFNLCENLKSIVFPGSVKFIGDSAFFKTGILNVYYMGSARDWNEIEIGDDNEFNYALTLEDYYFSNYIKHHYITSIPDSAYTGKSIKPAVNITSRDGTKEKKNTDYKVSYSNNTKIGVADAKITFSALNGGGEVIVHFNIVPANKD
jgi:hypothetical protein